MVSLPILTPAPTPPRSVRISLTDRCDFACVYCRPDKSDGYVRERMDADAIVTMAEGLTKVGTRRVRITGGEPLLRKDVVTIVGRLAKLGFEDLALTTNASRLAELARPLRQAGLERITISLDSLDPARFARLTRGGKLDRVLAGIDAAMASGFDEVKLNCVVVRGENDDELEAIVRFAWERGIVPRFLEVMTIGEGAKFEGRVVTGAEMRAKLAHLLEDATPVREDDRGPARYVFARGDSSNKVGFITGASDTYCAGCDRLRVSSDGVVRPCLATDDGVRATDLAERGDTDGIAEATRRAWKMKPDGETWDGCNEPGAAKLSIRAIGG
ncbi:MAG TPA: GTP 3',8-cyclase MoaA [Polyangiaceae bacterium]